MFKKTKDQGHENGITVINYWDLNNCESEDHCTCSPSKETVQSIMNNRDAGEMRGNSRWKRGEGDLQG